MAVKSSSAARHICNASGWTLTNLALQKLLYISHMGFVGVSNGKLLVSEPFQAWAYGPVLPNVYRRAKMFGNKPVKDVFYDAEDISKLPEGMVLDKAWLHLKHKTASELVGITHWSKGAWAKTYEPGIFGCEIPTNLILEEYNSLRVRQDTHVG